MGCIYDMMWWRSGWFVMKNKKNQLFPSHLSSSNITNAISHHHNHHPSSSNHYKFFKSFFLFFVLMLFYSHAVICNKNMKKLLSFEIDFCSSLYIFHRFILLIHLLLYSPVSSSSSSCRTLIVHRHIHFIINIFWTLRKIIRRATHYIYDWRAFLYF